MPGKPGDPSEKKKKPEPSRFSRIVAQGIDKFTNIPIVSKTIPISQQYVPEDEEYLHQYMNPDKDLIPRTNERPTRLTINPRDKTAWRQLPRSYPGSSIQEVVTKRGFALKPEELQRIQPGQVVPLMMPYEVPDTVAGLGAYTASLGRDEQGPYMSVYDKWDFDSPHVNFFTKGVMDRLGKAYNIYERLGISPTTGPEANDGAYRIIRRNKK